MSVWTLHHGDCLAGMATLPDRSIDVVITDPPYSEHVHASGRRAGKGWRKGGGASLAVDRPLGFDCLSPETMAAAAEHFGRLARRWVLVFCDAESTHLWRASLVSAGLEYVRTGLWLKSNGAPQFTGDRPAVGHEEIVIAHPKGRKRWSGGGKQAVYDIPIVLNRNGARNERIHTTQKPLALMDALVRDFTERGELVLDPFAGSATTGVACIRNGRRFVGWEQDAKYHALGTKRLDATREQFALFEDAL